MRAFLENGAGLAVLAAAGVLGIIIKLITNIRINRLVRQSQNMSEAKDRQLKQWKLRFENTYRMNKGINNVLVYIRKNFMQYRIFGVSMFRVDRINVTMACVVIMAAFSFSAYTMLQSMEMMITERYIFAGLFLAGIMLIWERICATGEKKESVVTNLADFYENTLVKKLEMGADVKKNERRNRLSEAAMREERRSRLSEAAMREERGNRLSEAAMREERGNRLSEASVKERRADRKYAPVEEKKKDTDYLKQSMDAIAAVREPEAEYVQPTRRLTDSEESIIKEFIKEYL